MKLGAWDRWGGCLVAKAAPNRHGPVQIFCYPDAGVHVVHETDDHWDDGAEYDNWPDAKKAFDDLVAHLAKTPNWDAQAEYDAAHGTDNGCDPRILAWEGEY